MKTKKKPARKTAARKDPPLKKTGFWMPAKMLEQVRKHVSKRPDTTMNAFVRAAVGEKLARVGARAA